MVKSILPIPFVADFEFLIVERLVYPWFLDGEAYLITGLLFPFFFNRSGDRLVRMNQVR